MGKHCASVSSVGVRSALTVALLCLAAQTATVAATYLWDGGHGSSNNWSFNSNWNPNSAPAQPGNTSNHLQFGGVTRLTPNMQAHYTVGSVSFVGGAGAFTLGSDTGSTLTIGTDGVTNNSTNLQTITNNLTLQGSQSWDTANGDITVTGNVASAWHMTLTKTGTGTLHLAGNNAGLVGPAAVSQGTLLLSHNNALGSSTYGNTVASGATLALQNTITVTEGDFTLSGAGHAGGGALRNVSGNNVLNADIKLAANTTITSAAGRLTLDKTVTTYGYTVTLDGPGDIVTTGQYSGAGGKVVVTGSGDRTFNGAINTSTGVTLSGTGATTFNAALNFSSSGTLTVNSGDINIGAAVNAVNLNQTGGTTTFSGDGNVTITNFNVTGGEVVFDKTSGHLRSDDITITGGTVSFLNDNQIFQWDDVTLADGAVLNLNDTTQNIDKLTVIGDAIIDFGEGGSDFSINDLILTGEVTLTITNWNNAVDEFFADYNPGSSSLAKVVFDGYGDAVWDPHAGGGFITPGTPVPEPSTYGALLLTATLGCLGCRRQRRPA